MAELNSRTSSFDFDWRFNLGDPPGAAGPDFDDSQWRTLDVPHDYSIEQAPREDMPDWHPSGFYPGGVGWYRKQFAAPADVAGKRVTIQFDGVYHRSDVYVNGHHLGHRPYGYVSLQYDLTPYLRPGEANVLAVRVDHSDSPTSRWYSGSGIYRHVWLTVTDALHVAHWGTYVTTPEVTADSALVRMRSTIENETEDDLTCQLVTVLLDPQGRKVGEAESRAPISGGTRTEFTQEFTLPAPALWSVETPVLYTAVTQVYRDDRLVDETTTPFGVRHLRFDPQEGFFLNGVSTKLKGVCLHHDGGCVGAAVPRGVWERRLRALKEMGCNAIRTSHNHPAPELLDLCDRLGFMVMDEAFDKWRGGYYAEHFDQWAIADLDGLLRRDRNHPCVIIWSVGNEVDEQGSPVGAETCRMLADYVRQHEPTRPVTYAAHPDRHEGRCVNHSGFSEPLDIVSYNYQEHWFEQDRAAYPGRLMIASEALPYFHGRTDYGTDRPLHNQYCSYDPINPWWDVVKHDYVLGQFIWAGIDYLGESAGWPSKGWPNAPIDSCGWLKPRANFHLAAWREDPVVRLGVLHDSADQDPGHPMWGWPRMVRHWNFADQWNQLMRVETCTNCESVELLLNGQSLGLRRADDYPNRTILWYVPYAAGKLEAIGRNGSEEVAHDELHTSGEAVAVEVQTDRTDVTADGQEVAHLEVTLVDANGIRVQDADRLVDFGVAGPARLIGVDNGDLRCREPYKGASRTTYQGRCLGVVQAGRETGQVVVTIRAAGLPEVTVHLQVQ